MKCSKCGAEFDAKFCPECGTPANGQPVIQTTQVQQPVYQSPTPVAPQKKKGGCLKGGLIVIGVIIVIAVIASIAGGEGNKGGSTSTSAQQASQTTQASATSNKWDDKFEVKDLKLSGSGVNAKITGSIVNKTDKEYGYLQVEINLYDASGAQLGSTLANVNNLEAKGTWKFEAYALKDGVKTVKVKDVTGF
ncbi:MAG: zinc ribbon domain-containing protein [Ruminococcaceae bacterium]|nr:zinc ribbon domain-containing protein [Oscillospiraceae bacterium]